MKNETLSEIIIMPSILIPGLVTGAILGACLVGGFGLCYLFCYVQRQPRGIFVDVPASPPANPLPTNNGLRQEQAPVGEVEMSEIRDGNDNEAMPSHPDSTGSEGGIVDVIVEHAQEAGVSATVNTGPLVEQTGPLFIGAPFEEHLLH